jgi:hypothetical protein
MVELYHHASMCLHGTVLNWIIKYRDNFTFYHLRAIDNHRIELKTGLNVAKETGPAPAGNKPRRLRP